MHGCWDSTPSNHLTLAPEATLPLLRPVSNYKEVGLWTFCFNSPLRRQRAQRLLKLHQSRAFAALQKRPLWNPKPPNPRPFPGRLNRTPFGFVLVV